MKKADITEIIDEAKFTRTHLAITLICALLLIFDGYDLFIYGVVLPVLMDEWSLSPAQAGALGSYALFGMMFGALFFGTLADRIGRRKGILICFLLFSIATVLNGMVTTPLMFAVFRFIAGLGCGGLMPNVVSLMNEYAPRRLRNTLVALMFSGYALGGMLAAGIGIFLLPLFGWQSMFFAAAVPLLILPFIMYYLPESIGFLIREGKQDKARHLLTKLSPDVDLGKEVVLESRDKSVGSASVKSLFSEGRAIPTMMIWTAFFCCLLMVYALSSWLPKLMANAGYSLGSSLGFLLVLNLGSVVGAIWGGSLGDRFNIGKVLVVFFAVSALSISLLGINSSTPILYLLIAIAGATTIGTQILLYACAAQTYGLNIRSTGLGWASGIGRNGAIVGPILGGVLMGIQLPLQYNFIAFALPGVIAAIAMMVFVLYTTKRAAAFSQLNRA